MDVCAEQGRQRPAHIAIGHKSAPQPLEMYGIPSDCASLDGVPPGESLKSAESCQGTGTLDTNPSCDAAAYSEVGGPHN
jgi:hypothetical protein